VKIIHHSSESIYSFMMLIWKLFQKYPNANISKANNWIHYIYIFLKKWCTNWDAQVYVEKAKSSDILKGTIISALLIHQAYKKIMSVVSLLKGIGG
jgi:hypothetical protein